jgi:hypothetical protein
VALALRPHERNAVALSVATAWRSRNIRTTDPPPGSWHLVRQAGMRCGALLTQAP